MIKVTDFSEFSNAVKEMLGKSLEELKAELRGDGRLINPKDIVEADNGLYSIIEKDGQLYVARVLLHILERDVGWLYGCKRTPEGISEASERGYIILQLNKYHFMHCGTLKDMFASGRRYRYRQSQRFDGTFMYHYLQNNNLIYENTKQKLHACKNCLKQAKIRHGLRYTVDNFLPKYFFDHVDNIDWILDEGYISETQDIGYNVYSSDWMKISERVKKMRDYTCEICRIMLKKPTEQKYLHCHHVVGNKSDNRFCQLQCLCIKCHAEQYKHGRIKTLSDYKEFLPIWRDRMS